MASTKHFINNATHLVHSALKSAPLTNPHCALDLENKIVYKRAGGSSQVGLVSGGGAGHEPSFSAFVGPGVLSAAVCGTIFASPSAEQVRRCLFRHVDSSKGVLVIVMNYTGDVMNFGVAVEKAKAAGKAVEMVVVGDDCGVSRSRSGKVGRRGLAGTVLVQKIAGALAATGASLEEVRKAAQVTADNTVTIGVSLAHVHVPGRDTSKGEDALASDEVEVGMGIHNESGAERSRKDLPRTVETMLKYMLDTSDKERAFTSISKSDETVLMVNNLGGVSPLELGGITSEVMEQLQRNYGISPVRVYAGTYMTSLNGMGFSISLLKVSDVGPKRMLDLLDAHAEVTAWTNSIKTETWTQDTTAKSQHGGEDLAGATTSSNLSLDSYLARKMLKAGLESVIAAEPTVTHYDTVVGDGDCGIGLQRGAESILAVMSKGQLDTTDAVTFVEHIVSAIETSMDGTSGAIYAIFLNALVFGLRGQNSNSATNKQAAVDVAMWAKAAEVAMESLGQYTPARTGDRTLMDALQPFVEQLKATGDVKLAAAEAEKGAEKTKGMKASLGRTVYVGGGGWQDVPDPGAYGLAQFLTAFAAAI